MDKIVYITGDVHYINDTVLRTDEYKLAERYIDIIKEYNAKATLFVTGRCIAKHHYFWDWMAQKEYTELGAHTYKAFNLINKVFDKLNGEPYGNSFYQYLDIYRTVRAFKKINYTPISWRTHSYASNKNTRRILASFGFRIISDEIVGDGSDNVVCTTNKNVLRSTPINVYPDDRIAKFYKLGQRQMMKEEGEKVEASILKAVAQERTIITQLHPVCMEWLDNFETFKRILTALQNNGYLFRTISDLAHLTEQVEVGK